MGHVVKRGARWQGNYRDASKRERSKTFATQAEAKTWVTTSLADLARGTWIDPAAGRGTFAQFAEQWIAQGHWRASTRRTIDITMRSVLPVLGDRPLGSLRRSDIQAWLGGLDLAPSTVGLRHRHVVMVLNAAVEDERITRNPAVGVRLPEVVSAPIVPVSPETVWALEDAAAPSFRAVVVCGAGLGLRRSEALGLSVDRVDFLRRQVRIDRQVITPAGGQVTFGPLKTKASYRTIAAGSVVLEELSEHVREFGVRDGDGLLFQSAKGLPIGSTAFDVAWQATTKRAGVTGVRFHDLRHHFASALISEGCSVKAVQEALGHASAAETLDTYSHLWPSDHDRIRGAVDATLRRPGEGSCGQSADKGH